MSHISKDRVSRINLSLSGRGLLMAGAIALAGGAALRRNAFGRVVLVAAGAALAYKSVTGHSGVYRLLGIRPVHFGHDREQGTLYVTHTLTIDKPAAELYGIWRDFSQLPKIFRQLEEVRVLDERRSHWRFVGPLGRSFEWESEITLDLPNQEIRWQSVPGADIANRGIVRFEQAPGNRGTVLRVQMIYDPPAGKLGAAIAALTGDEPHQQLKEELRRWKQRLETGEIATTEGQTSGRR
ncbi:MAG: SRPBCC family protein [Pseudomonadota bacterium]|nr:SRPBCC family protein [Pseudomonadota bacterium]